MSSPYRDSRRFRSFPASYGARHEAELAGAYLNAASRGEPCRALAVALAEAVLAAPSARLALAVLDGGPHAQVRATELAVAVLRGAAITERQERAGGQD